MEEPSMAQLDMKHIERVLQHLPRSGDITLIALKGHLLIEEMLDEIIWAHCKSPDALQDVEIRFPAKIKLVLALTGTHELAQVWSLCEKLNSLRNSLAHKIEHPAAQKKLNAFFAGFGNDYDWQPTTQGADDLWSAIAILIGAIQGVRNPLVLKTPGVAA